ncbi:MAG: flavodoxin family protein, partial [Erythrobacter sp.]|nr:flavodoxin family protein [Erythrobacter sp.]
MLDETQKKLCEDHSNDYSDLRALTINCTLKRSPEGSHTDKLLGVAEAILVRNNVSLDQVRLVDHEIAPGVYPDMAEHGAERDDWPKIWKKVDAADILVIGTPIWLGEKSSVCQRLIERLYAHSSQTNDKGQYVFYGKVGGCIV